MVRRGLAAIGAGLALWLPAVSAGAHIDLTYPPMRYAYTNDGQKVGPCGTGTPTGVVTTFAPGQTITVTWDETIDHPGHFRISLDDDGGEDDLADPTGYDDFYTAPSVLLDDIADTGGSTHSAEITLPDTECELCTLQLIQVMTDKAPWGPAGGNELYYWCADISIQAGGTGGAPGTGGSSGASSGGGAGAAASPASSQAPGDDGGCTVGSPARGGGQVPWIMGLLGLAVVRRALRVARAG